METEVKLEVADLAPIRDKLHVLGAVFRSAEDETNVYVDRDGALAARGESLRVRQDQRVRLTWKGPTDFQNGIVNRAEIEIDVSSFADALAILSRLGFEPSDRVAKRRETWRLRDVEITLDTLSFGTFVELEGKAAAIREVAAALGLDPGKGIRSAYRKLQRERRSADGV